MEIPSAKKSSDRRFRLYVGAGLIVIAGCGDDTVRGAGSIDIPKSKLKSYIPTKEAPIGKLKPAQVPDTTSQ